MSVLENEYWRANRAIMTFAVDTLQSTNPNDGPLNIVITEDVFLDRIYAPRTIDRFEERIADNLVNATSVVCVAGPRGAGKSSAVRYAMREIARSRPDIHLVLIDIRRLWDQWQKVNLHQEPGEALRSCLCLTLEERLFPNPVESRQLASWLLAGPPDETDFFEQDILSDLRAVATTTLATAGVDSSSRSERVMALARFFHENPEHLGKAFERFRPALRSAHLMVAFTRLQANVSRVLVVCDNGDQLPPQLQPKFLDLAQDLQRSIGGLCRIGIVLRKENLRALAPTPNPGADALRVVEMEELEFSSSLLPSQAQLHVREVFERRHRYAEVVSSAGMAGADDQALHAAVVNEVLDHSVSRLANHSMRTVGEIYEEFVRFLSLIRERRLISHDAWRTLLAGNDAHLQTLFFLWLREKGKDHDIVLYDVWATSSLQPNRRFCQMASPHHLLVTAILNMTERLRRTGARVPYPPFSEVMAAMTDVGFSLEVVQDCLRHLVAKSGEQLRSIEFVEADTDIEGLRIGSSTPIRLTPLGEQSITSVFHKVGYVWGSAYQAASADVSYLELSVSRRMLVLYDYVTRKSKAHLEMMKALSAEWSGKQDWLREYRGSFGVQNRTQIERILDSARIFYRKQFASGSNVFEIVLEAYSSILTRIERREDPGDFSEIDRGKQLLHAAVGRSTRFRDRRSADL